jgi:hypothetical protein
MPHGENARVGMTLQGLGVVQMAYKLVPLQRLADGGDGGGGGGGGVWISCRLLEESLLLSALQALGEVLVV